MAPDFTTRGGGYSVCASNAWHYLAGVIGPKRYADFAPKVSRLIDCGEEVRPPEQRAASNSASRSRAPWP